MSIESTLLAHLARYPAMQLADVYKLVHQAAMGSKHAIRDVASASNWLTRELTEMGDGIPEPLFDLLSDETGIVRVHLRTYITFGGDPAQLLDVFIYTANEHKGDVQLLEGYWNTALSLAENGGIPFSPKEMNTYFASLKAGNFPAVHHSSEYARLYRPAYRVVKKSFLITRIFPKNRRNLYS